MGDYEAKARAFHTATGLAVGVPFSAELLQLRKKLILEEVEELCQEIDHGLADLAQNGAVAKDTVARLLKEMADVQYVLSGMAVTFGLPMGAAFERVHTSNLSKLGPDGKPVVRADGKVLKGPNYKPPILDDLTAEV